MADRLIARWAAVARALAASRRLGPALFVAGPVVLWLSVLSVPVVEPVGVDQAWQAALAHFYKTGAQAGVEYVFTFGPLGYFYTTAFDAELYWHKYAWELAAKLAFVLLLAGVARRMASAAWKAALLVLAALFLGVDPRGAEEGLYGLFVSDALYAMVILAAGLLLIDAPTETATDAPDSRPWSPWHKSAAVALLTALLAVLALVKFTFLVLATLAVGVAALSRLRPHGRTSRPWPAAMPTAALIVGVYAGALVALWLALGQSPANVPAYLRGSWEIARGYADAMALDGSHWEAGLALAALALVAVELAVLVGGRGGAWAAWALVVPVLLVQWKHGFTRQDKHAFGFFAFASVAPVLLLGLAPVTRWRRLTAGVLASAAVALAAAGMHSVTQAGWDPDRVAEGWWTRLKVNAGFALTPSRERERLASAPGAGAGAWDLARLRAEVGDATVDSISSLPSVVLRNGMNWRPRPVFQSYSAYTPYLQALNARFLRSVRAPEFLVLALAPIDRRLPTLEDAPALREMFRLYSPVMVERNCLLLRRNPAPAPPEMPGPVLLDRTVRFDEQVELGGGAYQVMNLEFRRSAWGAVRGALLRPPVVWMTVGLSGGQEMTYRVVPEMAADGFLVNPFVGNYDDVLKAYGRPGAARVRAVKFSADCGPGFYEDRIRVTVRSAPGLVTYRATGPAAKR